MENVKASAIKMSLQNRSAGKIAILGVVAGFGLAGCGLGPATGATGAAVTTGSTLSKSVAGSISGKVHGGQQPVTGATIQLYTVGTSGLKSAATPLIKTTVTTSDGSGTGGNAGNAFNTLPAGNFTITGDYSCTGATQVYLVATGGNSGAAVNTAIALMAPLGSCASLLANAASTFLQINELTTVASAYALAPFMSGYANVGSGSSTTGLINAVGNFNNLVNVSTGAAGGANLPAGATVPTAELNTLANILAACINSTGSTSGNCNTLFGAAGGTDTVGAALGFANNPGSSTLTALYALGASQAPFQPNFSAAPNDWTVAIKYNGGGTFSSPYGIAIDAAGNAWITNTTASGQTVEQISPAGGLLVAPTNVGGGLIGPKGIAIDLAGNVWVANPALNSVVELNSSGAVQSGANGYTGGGLNGPVALAIDSGNNVWVANLTGNSVTELSSTGAVLQNGLTGSGTISLPTGVALDKTGNVYVANNGNGNVVKLTHAGAAASGSPFSDVALQGTTSVAVDLSGNVWATGSTTGATVAGAVSQFNSAGTAVSYSPLSNGGLSLPTGSAIAGTTVWVANGQTSGSLSELGLSTSTPLSPSTGFGSLSAPVGVAVDPSGSVWVTDSGDNTVAQFIGLSTPVTTPLAANVGP